MYCLKDKKDKIKKLKKLKSMKDFFIHDVSCVIAMVAIFGRLTISFIIKNKNVLQRWGKNKIHKYIMLKDK